MDITETRALCAWLQALIPSQRFDDDTPEAWQPILRHVDVADARACVLGIIEREAYVAPRDIAQAARRLRRDRLEHAGFAELAPNVAPLIELEDGRRVENPEHRAEKLALREAIASGRLAGEQLAAYRAGELPTFTGAPKAIEAGQPVTSRDMSRGVAAALQGVAS